ncbi:STAS domain-containing protein [Actinoplanes sp. NPDC051851]|uniref:STAS domain-containing protein n=1 Tax=Actinoplanes sp. NPDC051851 TaxID=3154753 RepID=UPI0034185C5D
MPIQRARKRSTMQASVTDHRCDVAVLHLRGELDADTAGRLYTTLADLLERPVPRIVVDLTGLRFCDSVGLSAFITSKQVIAARGGWLSFAGADDFLTQLMKTVGLSRYFAIFPEVEDAIAAAQL